MPLPLNLVTLPYEVRTAIFGYYFQLDGGYVFNAESEKLVDANRQPINLSLMYTCRSIANETKDMPFAVNTISFSTFYSPRWRAWAGRFEYLSTLHYFLQLDLLTYLGQFIATEMYSLIEDKFPGFGSMLKLRIENNPGYRTRLANIESGSNSEDDSDRGSDDHTSENHTGEDNENDISSRRGLKFVEIGGLANSYCNTLVNAHVIGIFNQHKLADGFSWRRITQLPIMREAVAYSLRLVAEQQEPRFTMLIDAALPGWTASHSPQEMHDLYLHTWIIPSQLSLARMGEWFEDGQMWQTVQGWRNLSHSEHPLPVVNYRERFRFSAAAASIQFLSHLQPKQRMRLRKMALFEDHHAVGDPQGHAVGLIPFCQENSRLKVERHLKLSHLNNAFNQSYRFGYIHVLEAEQTMNQNPAKITISYLWEELGCWLSGAIYLGKIGMPANSFTLILDGEPAVGFSSEFFDQVLHRYIAFEKAFRECKACTPSRPRRRFYAADGVMEAVQDLVDQHSSDQTSPSNTSLVSCNFNPGRPWNIESLVQKRFNWALSEWEKKSSTYGHMMNLPSGYPCFSKRFLQSYEREPQVRDEQDQLEEYTSNSSARET